MIRPEKIIVALDTSHENEAMKLLESLKDQNVWVKIGMELFYSQGSKIIFKAKELGLKVFLDLKLHDIPNTVHNAVLSLGKLPIDMINIHAAGGSEMMKEASRAIKSLPHSPLLIAVTQLTSTTTEQMNREQRIPGDILESVSHLAKLAQESGCDGVVSSPLEVPAIKLICGSRFITVTPGIRPVDSQTHDQKRFTTPEDAVNLGTDFMVIGRPITQASDPKVALEKIIQGIS